MNRKIGMFASLINICAVIVFALSMIIKSSFLSYIASMFIAFSFIPIISAFCFYSKKETKAAAYTSLLFASIYAALIFIVYFAQITSLRNDDLSIDAIRILDYKKFGLFFNYNLLGYGIMALSTFFIGLTVRIQNGFDKYLKWLFILHGTFFISCFVLPILGVFSFDLDNADFFGVLALEIWCLYFIPIDILSFMHFKNKSV